MSSELMTNLGEEIGFYGATAANSGELVPHANLLKAMRDIEAALQELRAENERLKVDAERYAVIRDAGSLLKIYMYDNEQDATSGDWVYKPHPQLVDEWADTARASITKEKKE